MPHKKLSIFSRDTFTATAFCTVIILNSTLPQLRWNTENHCLYTVAGPEFIKQKSREKKYYA